MAGGTREQEASVRLKGTEAASGFEWKVRIYSGILMLMQCLG